MLARNYAIAALTAATIFAIGYGLGFQQQGNNVNTKSYNFSHSVVPAPSNTTTFFSFVHSIIPGKSSDHGQQISNQGSHHAGEMRSGFGNSR